MALKKVSDYIWITCPSKFIQKEELVKDKPLVGTQVNTVKESDILLQDAKLIKLHLSFTNGHTEDALIDPGCEMDIMNQDAWIKSQAPMTYTMRTAMRDAGDQAVWRGDSPKILAQGLAGHTVSDRQTPQTNIVT